MKLISENSEFVRREPALLNAALDREQRKILAISDSSGGHKYRVMF